MGVLHNELADSGPRESTDSFVKFESDMISAREANPRIASSMVRQGALVDKLRSEAVRRAQPYLRTEGADLASDPKLVAFRPPHRRNLDHAAEVAATERLLGAFEELATSAGQSESAQEKSKRIQAVAELYHDWVVLHHQFAPGEPGVPDEKRDLLLHCMAGASTLAEAIEFLARFHGVIYNSGSSVSVRHSGECLEITLDQPFRPGTHGLLSEIWPLSLFVRELEFLVGCALEGVKATVRHPPCLSLNAEALLFDGSLAYGAGELALLIPRRHLLRSVVASPRDIPDFFKALFPAMLARGARRPAMRSLVAGLLRNDKLRNSDAQATLESVSARLGCGAATARRRLRAEGTGFREIRDSVFDELAKLWLHQVDLRLDVIAERLGYSDAFAFRRSFKRCNGYSPSAYRHNVTSTPIPVESP